MRDNIQKITWECIRSGQVRAYGDSVTEYLITVPNYFTEDRVHDFCRTCICNMDPKYRVYEYRHFSGGCGFPMGMNSFYYLDDLKDNKWRFAICHPYSD